MRSYEFINEGGVKKSYLWHGSTKKIPKLEPRQAVDVGGAEGSNKHAIYATLDKNTAIKMGMAEKNSDTGMLNQNDQLILFKGKLRHGKQVYLHKLPRYDADGKDMWLPGGNSNEFYTKSEIKELKPLQIISTAVDQNLKLVRKPTKKDLELRKYYLNKSKQKNNSIKESFDNEAEKYKAHLIKTLPLLMNFLSKTSKDYLPTEDEMLDVIETGYEVMLQYGDVNKAGEVVRNKLKSLISKEGVEEDTDYDNDKPLRLRANTDRVQKFIEAVYTRYPETFQNNHVMSWGSGNEQEIALFELIPNMNKPNAVEIKWIQAYPLRQGIGSRAMKILQSMAREHDVILTLYPWDKGQISQSKLIKFYRQMGFKPTTKGSKNMIWQGVSEGSYVEGGSITHESLYVDVPNEDWLQGKIDYAKKKGRDQWGVPFFNATTAYFTQDVRVPIQILRRLSGMRNEQKNVRSNDLKAIKKIMKDTGKLPTFHIRGIHNDKEYVPFIMVAYNGEAWVSEGNHRIMAAADLFDEGDKRFSELPIELKYFDGGERVKSGPLSPEKIGNQNVMEGSYREGGSITHDGVEYDFDSVMSIAEKMPTKTCSVDKLSWVLQYDTPNKERLERADITVPLIVTKSVNGKLAAIDGLHRLAKAVRDNVKTLPVKYIKPSELESAKLNKQGVAEGASENAWNSGISDEEFINKFGKREFDRLTKKYGQSSIPVPDLHGHRAKEPTDLKVRAHRGLDGPGAKLKSLISKQGVAEGVTESATVQGLIDKITKSFVSSPVGKKYAKHDCKTVTRAFVHWADQNQIPTQVITLAPPSAVFIKKNPRFQGKSGEGDGHIMPIVDGQAIDFTVRQFGVNRPFERPLITPVADLQSVYGRFGYFTDRPEWFLGGKTHWIGPLNQIPAEIFNQEFGDEILEQSVAEGLDYMAGHCHVMALALKKLHPDWQIRAHIGWDEEAEDDDDYRIDHVYIVAPDGTAHDCRGKFNDEQELVGPDETGGVETQIVDYSIDDMKKDVARGELKRLNKQDIQNAISFLNDQKKTLKQGVAEGKMVHTYLWHGSRQKITMLEPRQAVDIGGAAGSNQNAIYATADPKIAIAMGMPTADSDYGHFPNDSQMVLFSGKIRKGKYVYLHKLPFNGPDGKPQFVQGGHSREFHSIPKVQGIKPIEIKKIPVNKYLNLVRKATPADLKLRKKYMKKKDVSEVWSEKYKRSIDCNNPKGFSQRAHCAGRKKRGKLK